MKIHKNLVMKGEPDALRNLLVKINAHLSGGWSRDTENGLDKSGTFFSQPPICFAFPSAVARPEGRLWMIYPDDREVRAGSVEPKGIGVLTVEQINQVKDEFSHRFVEPFAALAGVQIELTSGEFRLEDVLSEDAASLFRGFTGPKTGMGIGLHHGDEQRWQRFIVAAHKENSKLDGATLHRWLVEEEHLIEEAASERVSEYEFARSLLRVYEDPDLAA